MRSAAMFCCLNTHARPLFQRASRARLLAGLTRWIVDGAEAHITRGHGAVCCIRWCVAHSHRTAAMTGRNSVELARVYRAHLDMRGALRTQVVGGLEASHPGQLVGFVELFPGGARHVDVQALRLVDPLLAACCGLDQPVWLHLERRGIQRLDVLRDAIDGV